MNFFKKSNEPSKILKLPNEILEKIFKLLTFHEQKEASPVCKRFYEVLQQHSFASRYSLVLRDYEISRNLPPFSVFANTERLFPNVAVEGDSFHEEFSTFWTDIGKHTTTLSLKNFNVQPTFLTHNFPNLQKIIFQNSEKHESYFLKWIPQTVTELHMDYLNLWMSPKEYDKFTETQHLKVLTAGWILYNSASSDETKMIADVSKDLLDVWKKYPGSKIKVKLNLLTEKVGFKDVIEYSEILMEILLATSNVANLEGISLKYLNAGTECFFIHRQLPLNNVKYLRFTPSDLTTLCGTCFKYLKKSCPQLSKLNIETTQKCQDDLNMLMKSIPKNTKHFEFYGFPPTCYDVYSLRPTIRFAKAYQCMESFCLITQNCVMGRWPDMPQLRKLHFLRFESIDEKVVKNLFEKYPKLTDFALDLGGIELKHIEGISRAWPRLEKLSLGSIDAIDIHKVIMKGGFKMLQFLKYRDKYALDPKMIGDIFKKLPSLRKLNDITYGMAHREEYAVAKR